MTVRAALTVGPTLLASYEGVGSYHLETPLNFFPLAERQRLVAECVQKSWDRALAVIVVKMLADRPRIEAALPKAPAGAGTTSPAGVQSPDEYPSH